ncbi:MAG: hypothetical protein AB8G05_00060 [Oligoflexales bacterium]
MRISTVRSTSEFEREIGLVSQAEIKGYVPEELTASDDVDLIYENISQGDLIKNVENAGQHFSKIILFLSAFLVYSLIFNFFTVESQNFNDLSVANLNGFLIDFLKNFSQIFKELAVTFYLPF